MMPPTCDAIIIGAGAAGLAVARTLEASGASVRVIERAARVGASWWQRYEGLRLNTVRWLSDLPFDRMPARFGRWPGRVEWASYLERYAEPLKAVELGVTVNRLEKLPSGWRIHTSNGVCSAWSVVVATGHDRIPRVPDWPGRNRFTGRLMHSSEFRKAEDLRGDDVLVVGTGNSGVEIAAKLAARRSTRVSISMRTPPLLLKREIGPIPLTVVAELSLPAPDVLVDWFGYALHRWWWSDLAPFGLDKPGKRLSAMRHSYYAPPMDNGFAAALKQGAIQVVPAVERFDDSEVVLQGGRTLRPDVVIAATGFRPGLEELLGGLGVLDVNGEPIATGGRQIPEAPGIFFVGFRFGLFALLPYLERDARAIAKAIKGRAATGGSLRRPLKFGWLAP